GGETTASGKTLQAKRAAGKSTVRISPIRKRPIRENGGCIFEKTRIFPKNDCAWRGCKAVCRDAEQRKGAGTTRIAHSAGAFARGTNPPGVAPSQPKDLQIVKASAPAPQGPFSQ